MGLQWFLGGRHLPTCGTACSLHCLHSDIKEVANVCNQSLMKLVIPEDDEMDEAKPSMTIPAEPTSEESLSRPEAVTAGESQLIWASRGVSKVKGMFSREFLGLVWCPEAAQSTWDLCALFGNMLHR